DCPVCLAHSPRAGGCTAGGDPSGNGLPAPRPGDDNRSSGAYRCLHATYPQAQLLPGSETCRQRGGSARLPGRRRFLLPHPDLVRRGRHGDAGTGYACHGLAGDHSRRPRERAHHVWTLGVGRRQPLRHALGATRVDYAGTPLPLTAQTPDGATCTPIVRFTTPGTIAGAPAPVTLVDYASAGSQNPAHDKFQVWVPIDRVK